MIDQIRRIKSAFSKWRDKSEPKRKPRPEFWAHVWAGEKYTILAGEKHKVRFMDENETCERRVHYDGEGDRFYVLHPKTLRRYDLVYA